MLLTNSERAKEVRSAILNIVIDVLNKNLGGTTKFINQREEDFLPSVIREYNYRQEFTNALDKYIESNKFKYAQLTDRIYKSIFKEDAKEYRQILSLNGKESVRATMYSDLFVSKFLIEMENICVAVADNIIDKELLGEIIISLLNEEEYDETLKLLIISALNAATPNGFNDL